MITNGKIIGEGISGDYHKQDVPRGDKAFVMSRSALCNFAECPQKWLRGYESKDTDATEWGTLLDAMVLDNEHFQERFAIIPPTYPAPADHARVKKGEIAMGFQLEWNGNANYCKEWKAREAGKTFAHTEDVAGATAAILRLKDDDIIGPILAKSGKQVMVTAEWHDEATGIVVPVKTLMDLVPNESLEAGNSVIDLKTARNAHPAAWVTAVKNLDYHVQSALYLDVWNVTGEKPREQFRHIISENEPPYQYALRWMSQEFMEMGRTYYRSALAAYCQCLATGVFPGFRETLVVNGWGVTEPTAWMMMQMERQS